MQSGADVCVCAVVFRRKEEPIIMMLSENVAVILRSVVGLRRPKTCFIQTYILCQHLCHLRENIAYIIVQSFSNNLYIIFFLDTNAIGLHMKTALSC